MSLYEFSCIRSGWMRANRETKPKDTIIPGEKIDEIFAAQMDVAEPTRELTPEEILARFVPK